MAASSAQHLKLSKIKSRRGSSSGHADGAGLHHHDNNLHDNSIQTTTLRSDRALDLEK